MLVQMVAASRHALWLASIVAVVLALTCASGCRETAIGKARGDPSAPSTDTDTLSAKQILQKGGVCDLDEIVDEPELDSDEWIIFRLYELALAENTEENFQAFRALFPEQRNTRQIREMYWTRARQNVHKFMNEPGKAGYTICRRVIADDGIKYYIKTSDKRQHPPPLTIGEADGKRKITAFTPF